jgi:hypothetical protein
MRLCWAFLIAAAVHAQAPSLLDQVKTRAAENLSRLPNYTCTETIERAQRQGKRGRIWPLDRVQVNVAYVNGKEFYGRVNEPKIDQPDLGQITGTPIGNGQFALFVKSIFSGGGRSSGRRRKPSWTADLLSVSTMRFPSSAAGSASNPRLAKPSWVIRAHSGHLATHWI